MTVGLEPKAGHGRGHSLFWLLLGITIGVIGLLFFTGRLARLRGGFERTGRASSDAEFTERATASLTGRASPGQFVVLTADGKHLVNTLTNKPVFITGDSAFSMVGQLSEADTETYFTDRESRGFNLVWIAAVDGTYCKNPPRNALGQIPFDGAPFTGMNEAFFQHLDEILHRAAAHHITVLLNPAFSGYPCVKEQGWCPQMESASDATMVAFGKYLGRRYKSYPNLMWLIGGDADITHRGKNIREKLNDLATGIRSEDQVHLMTAENIRGESALDQWSGSTWITLNALYNLPQDFVAAGHRNYQRRDFLPFFELEDWYEGEHGMTPLALREEAYWAVLSGAYLGQFFGNDAIWTFGPPSETMGKDWKTQLNSEGTIGREWLGKLFRSREHWKLVPDIDHTVVTEGYGSGSMMSVASRTSDGQTILVYIPNGDAATLTVDLSKISSSHKSAKCWWFDPRDGSTSRIGTFPNSGVRKFTPPDANDWILVVDDEATKLPVPGKSDL
jgi:Protein of unknown function (DUF4038)/Putative collagen-binding domain of a collagenase